MNEITVIGVDGVSKNIQYTNGDSLMEVLRDAGYEEIAAMCGGCCSCATCHVKIDDQATFSISPIEENEELLLEMTDDYDQASSRLSCQVTLAQAQAGLTVKIVEPE